MLVIAFVLFVTATFLMLPTTIKIMRMLNAVLEQSMSVGTALRVLFAYLLLIGYMVTASIYFVSIGHPIVILFFVVPTILGWLIQGIDKVAEKV